jgi:hypothetical protein
VVPGIRPIEVPQTAASLTSLARRRDGTGSAAVIVSLALLGLHMSVDRISDNGIDAARFVQVRAETEAAP